MIYNQGGSDADIDAKFAKLHEWVDVTNKLGSRVTSGVSSSTIAFSYNKSLGIIRCDVQVVFTSSSSSTRKVFDFNNNIPGSGASDIHAFGGFAIGVDGSKSVLYRIIPYAYSDPNWSLAISIDPGLANSAGSVMNTTYMNIKGTQYEAFNAYVGL